MSDSSRRVPETESHHRSSRRSRRRLANRLAAGMLVMLGMLTASTVWEIFRLERRSQVIKEVIEELYPISADAQEMEINSLGIALVAVSYLNTRDADLLVRIDKDRLAFEQAASRIRQLSLAEEGDRVEAVEELWRQLNAQAEVLTTSGIQDSALAVEVLTKIRNLLDVELDENLQASIERRLEARYESLSRQIRQDKFENLVVLSLMLILGAVVALSFQSRLNQALSTLLTGTDAIADGDLDHRLAVDREDELGLLASRFNLMTSKLQKTMVSRDQLALREQQVQETNRELELRLKEKAALESELLRSANDWQSTFDTVASGIVLLDVDGRVRRINQSASTMLGVAEDGPSNRALAEIAKGPLGRRVVAALPSIPESSPALVEDGDRVWSLMTDRNEVTGLSILQVIDVSEIFGLRRELITAKPAADLGRFVAGVAHEVRNPLFGILANLEAWREQPNEGFSTFGKRIESSARRMVALMSDLMELARPGALSRQQVDVKGLIASVTSSCLAVHQDSSVSCESHYPEGLTVPGDHGRLEQGLRNLVSNALSFSPPGGKVEVRVEPQGGRVIFRVADQGPGIAEEDLEHLFEPFFTRRRGGTGLGLAIVARVAEDHNGRAGARNRPQGGAEVWFELPIHQKSGA